MLDNAYDWCELIHDIAVGYDGYKEPAGLMSFIYEMREYSVCAMKCIKIFWWMVKIL